MGAKYRLFKKSYLLKGYYRFILVKGFILNNFIYKILEVHYILKNYRLVIYLNQILFSING